MGFELHVGCRTSKSTSDLAINSVNTSRLKFVRVGISSYALTR